MTVSQYDHVVPYTDLGGRGYLGVNAAVVYVREDNDSNVSAFNIALVFCCDLPQFAGYYLCR